LFNHLSIFHGQVKISLILGNTDPKNKLPLEALLSSGKSEGLETVWIPCLTSVRLVAARNRWRGPGEIIP